MPVRRKPELFERYEHSQDEWERRVAQARDLRGRAATWREVDKLAPEFIKVPAGRRYREWCARGAVKLSGKTEQYLGLLLSALGDRFDAVHMTAKDWGKRLGCDPRTVHNVIERLTKLDLVRVVPQYDDVEPYKGTNGKTYKRRRVANTVTLGDVGRVLFGPVALGRAASLGRRLRERLAAAVETLCVAPPSLARQKVPDDPSRSFLKDHLLGLAYAVNNPTIPQIALDNAAQARTRRYLAALEQSESPPATRNSGRPQGPSSPGRGPLTRPG